MELRKTVSLKKFYFLHQFCKALRKLDHVLDTEQQYWAVTAVSVQSKENFND